MYVENHGFRAPADELASIWRYMDFTKFVSLLDRQQLFFCRADKFEDRFEGAYPRGAHAQRDRYPPQIAELRRFVAINCWHMNTGESAAMWRLYLKSDEGIAVKSSFARLTKAFERTQEDVLISTVDYIDYDNDQFRLERYVNALLPYLHKRDSFAHERELRAMVVKLPKPDGSQAMELSSATPDALAGGLGVDVDLHALIEEVVVAPGSPEWLFRLIGNVAQKYGFDFTVRRSRLEEDPRY